MKLRNIPQTFALGILATLTLCHLASCGTPAEPAVTVPTNTDDPSVTVAAPVETPSPADTATPETETEPETIPHVHAFGDWITVQEASCSTAGKQIRTCSCGETEEQKLNKTDHVLKEIPAVAPTLTENGLSEGIECEVCGVLTAPRVVPYIGHTGLSYEVNSDGRTCSVTGLGECAETDLYIPAVIDGYTVTHVGERAFLSCADLVGVHFPITLTSIGEAAFHGCTGLTELTLPDNVTVLGDFAFSNCTALSRLTLSRGLTAVSRYGFYRCTSLEEVTVPDGVKSLEFACFQDCSGLTRVYLPNGLTGIGSCVFQSCDSLAEINLPDSLYTIDGLAFEGCDVLTGIRIPAGLRTLGVCAFARCPMIQAERVILPDTLHTVEGGIFADGPQIKEIVFPVGIKFPVADALTGVRGLTDVYYRGSEAQWNAEGYLVDEGVTVHFQYRPDGND